jgi:energy-coupling factor transporter ATP-binding protein EcfA2
MADLLVVTGPPGAGKSTVAGLVAGLVGRPVGQEPDDVALVPGDLFFSFRQRGGLPPWLPAAHEQNAVGIRAAAATAGLFAASGATVVYDGVVGPWFLPLFAAEVARQGLAPARHLHYAVLLPSLGDCRRRVAGRAGHGFTDDDATARMHHEFASAEVPPRHVLADPRGAPADVAALVLDRYAAGFLRYAG